MKYDCELFLRGEKRSDVLELHEVQQYGRDSDDDADCVSLYGLTPADCFARGVRLLGCTAVEYMRDRLAAVLAAAGAQAVSYL